MAVQVSTMNGALFLAYRIRAAQFAAMKKQMSRYVQLCGMS